MVTAQRPRRPRTTTAAFVSPGASPSVTRSVNAVASCYGVCKTVAAAGSSRKAVPKTVLHAKKKGKGGSGSKSGKLQVQLLKHVEGTGRVGDVVMVAPAFFENKLRKTNSAKLITDEEVKTQQVESAAKEDEKIKSAKDVAERIASLESVTFNMKAGPDGHLFGGIKTKDILGEIKVQLSKEKAAKKTLESKQVKVLKIEDAEGNSLEQDTIKSLGDFQATIMILEDVKADVTITVTSQ